MQCPTCSATLAATSFGNACLDGHGAFVHGGDWFPAEGSTLALHLTVLAKGHGVACPGCGGRTRHVARAGGAVDVCTRCNGAWTDTPAPEPEHGAVPGPEAALSAAWKALRAVSSA